MKKKNIIIRNGTLSMGGGEVILLNVLKNLNKEKYNMILLIDDDNGKDNIFLPDIPSYIQVYFLRPISLVSKVKYYYGLKNRNILDKIKYSYYLWKNNYVSKTRSLKIIDEVKEKFGDIDAFIDFNGGARKYIHLVNAKKKLLWRHLSMKEFPTKNKVERYGRYISKYDKIIAICNSMKDEIIRYIPSLAEKVDVAYNPIDLLNIDLLSEETSGINDNEVAMLNDNYIISVARIDLNQKDYLTLVKAYYKAHANGFDYKLYIMGNGPDKDLIVDEVRKMGLSKMIIFLGTKKNPFVWIKNSKFFVLSSKEEGFPTVIIEAMALGKCVVSSDCPVGTNELMKNGDVGILFPVGDIDELTNIFLRLYKNTDIVRKYESVCTDRVKEFGIEKTISRYEEIIDGNNM